MRKTKKTLAILAIVAMVVAILPVQAFAADSSALPTRLSGTTQYDTAATIAQQWTAPTKAVLAPGEKANLVDALAAGPLAAALDAPILLTDGKTLTDATKAALATVKTVYVVSGTAVIKQAVIDQLTAMGITVKNTYGAEAPDTSVAIAKAMAADAGVTITQVALANGTVGAQDAMSIASFAGAAKMPILVTDNAATLPAGVSSYLAGLTGITKRYVVGGTAVISDAEKAAFGTADRLAGATAYDTNDAVIKALATTFNNVFIANGVTLVDALAGAPLAAKKNAAIVLTDGTNATAAAYVNTKLSAASVVTALGGEAVVPAAVAAKVAYTAPAALAISSVTAINADQIQVVYNKAVDETTATDVTNYSIKRSGLAEQAFTAPVTGNYDATAELGADNQTVTITLTTALKNAGSWNLSNGDIFLFNTTGVEDADGNTIADTTTTVTYSDKVAPTYLSASAKAKDYTNTITLTFSEPVDTSVASVTVNGKYGTLAAGSEPNEIDVTTGDNLTAGSTYDLSLINFKDFAGNLITPNPVTGTVTVQSDTTAPNVTSVTVVRDSRIEVTFDKGMDATTLTTTNVKVLDPNMNATGITQGAITVKANTSNKTWRVALTALPFDSDGSFTGILVLTHSIKDSSGNALTAVSKNITVTEDSTAPSIVSSSYQDVTTYHTIAAAHGAIVVKYNESVALGASTAFTVVDDRGTNVATPFINASRAINPDDPTELVLPLNADVASTSKTYLIVMPKDAVEDLSIAANQSGATNISVDVSAGVPVASDSTKPSVDGVVETAATTSTSGTTIAVSLSDAGSGLDLTTVANTNNYRLAGAPLPTGTYVTWSTPTATIHIPAGSIAKDQAYAFNITGVADKAGNPITPYAGNVTLKDDTKPVMNAAVLNSNGTVSLGFSSAVTAAAGSESDFTVKVNGSTLAGATVAYTMVDGTGADDGKYVLSVQKRKVGIQTDLGVTTKTIGGRVYTAAAANNYFKVDFVDVNGNGTYDDGTDIVASVTDNAAVNPGVAAADGDYDLTKASTLSVATISTTTVVTDTSNLTNPLKGGTTITVK